MSILRKLRLTIKHIIWLQAIGLYETYDMLDTRIHKK